MEFLLMLLRVAGLVMLGLAAVLAIIFIIVAIVWFVRRIFRKPFVLVGKVIEKNFAEENDADDSYVTMKVSDGRKFLLKFTTHKVDNYVVVGCDVFYGKAKELNKAIEVDDCLCVETFDERGGIRTVNKILFVKMVKWNW